MVGSLTAARAAGRPALVRVANNGQGLIGRALDAGAQGIVCPLINSAEDAERLVRVVGTEKGYVAAYSAKVRIRVRADAESGAARRLGQR